MRTHRFVPAFLPTIAIFSTALVSALLFGPGSGSAAAPDCAMDVEFHALPSTPEAVQISVTLTPSPGHYIYGPESTDGLPTDVGVLLVTPEGERALAVTAPPPLKKKDVASASSADDGNTPVYAGPTVFFSRIPATAGTVRVEASGLLCASTSCTPFNKELTLDIPPGPLPVFAGTPPAASPAKAPAGAAQAPSNVARTTGGPSPELAALLAEFTPRAHSSATEVTALGEAIFFGLLAGLLLNLMPCVLPVVSLKFSALLAVSAMSDKASQAKAFRTHCLIFAAGILTWFLILAMLLGGAGWAWGELFQSPVVLSILAFILFASALSLFGVFSLPLLDLKVSAEGHPHIQAFAGGLLATLLATPCSGPLLGGVLSWALLQPLPVLTLAVVSVGVGMALPYGVLAMSPGLVHLLPRPGDWTILLEQFLGILLIAGAVYLIILLPADWTAGALLCLTAVGFAAWLWGQVGHLGAGPMQRAVARIAAGLVVALALLIARPAPPSNFSWEPFDPQTFTQILGKEPILLEFTADWCPSCKALEHTTLSNKRMERLQNNYKMRTIRVDLTREDPTSKALLKAVGSVSIPVVALFPAGEAAKTPVILRDLITPSQLKDALKKTF